MKLRILLFLSILPLIGIAQERNNFRVVLKNGVLLNKKDFKHLEGNLMHTEMDNTLHQGIGILYSRNFKSGLIASAGIDVGYEKFSGRVRIPFESYGFVQPEKLDKRYEFNHTIPYAQLNLNIGYKFKCKFDPEVRLGWIFNIPRNAERFGYKQDEMTDQQFYNYAYTSEGWWGSISNDLVFDNIAYVYVGGKLPLKIGGANRVSAGIQLQRKLVGLGGYAHSSYLKNTFYDKWGWTMSSEEFKARHTAINILIAYDL